MSELFEDILLAMDRGDLLVYYQPQYHAFTSRLNSAEALCRWRTSDGTIVEACEFIPELEKGYNICTVDWYVLEEVCKFLSRRMKEHKYIVPVSVNFSLQHTKEMHVAGRITEIVDKYGIDHSNIIIEITESAYVDAPNETPLLIEAIRGKGFSVAMDNFGRGLSSLIYLSHIQADYMKIDRSLIQENCETERERIVLESIFDCAHRLNVVTVAEGVETKEQLAFMRTSGCNLIQGRCFDMPLPEEEFEQRLDATVREPFNEDILSIQSQAAAKQLLLDAIFTGYPLIIYTNLTRNSFYMMNYDNFTSQMCPSAGVYTELIEHGASTMHPEDRMLFKTTFNRQSQIDKFRSGAKSISVVTRQCGDDGIYRRVQTTNYFVKNPDVDDVLVITLCQNLD
ncbi:MAG: EAL domain-containing protein [Lachnospiraceae bacterium]|nr:EAL domain-containing protein [Lachnospiraceae bacterium]